MCTWVRQRASRPFSSVMTGPGFVRGLWWGVVQHHFEGTIDILKCRLRQEILTHGATNGGNA